MQTVVYTRSTLKNCNLVLNVLHCILTESPGCLRLDIL